MKLGIRKSGNVLKKSYFFLFFFWGGGGGGQMLSIPKPVGDLCAAVAKRFSVMSGRVFLGLTSTKQ